MISSGGAVVDGTRASHVAPALSFPPHHPLYPPTVPEFLRPPLPSRYRHPNGASGNSTSAAVQQSQPPPSQQQQPSIVPVSSVVTSPLAITRTLTKDDDDYSSYRLYPYPYPYSPYLYPLVRPLDFSYTSPPHSPLVNSANALRNGNKTLQLPLATIPPVVTPTTGSSSSSVRQNSASSTTTLAPPPSQLHPPPPPLPPVVPLPSSTPNSSPSSTVSSSASIPPPILPLPLTNTNTAKDPLKSRLLRKRSRTGPSASFARGSLIRLASGELRRVEEMRTEDFITSAEECPALRLDPSTVVRIDAPADSETAILTLSYGQHRSQTEVECTADHPYFVYGQGWASCRPDRTLAAYGLKVHQLQVGDVCISLTPRVGSGNGNNGQLLAPQPTAALCTNNSSTIGLIPAHSNSSAPLLDRKRRWSAPDEIHELPPPPAHQQPPPSSVKD